jgi:hypothetical protein
MGYACSFCGVTFEKKRQMTGHEAGRHIKGPRLSKSTVRVDGLTDLQIGYLAAYLDGEGGIQITRTTRKDREYTIALHPVVYFTNTNRESIDTLKQWISAGTTVVARQREGRKPGFVLHVTGTKNVLVLLGCLRPHLIIKASRADVMLRYCSSRASHLRGKERRYTEEELSLYTTLKTLNERRVKSNANARISDKGGEISKETL